MKNNLHHSDTIYISGYNIKIYRDLASVTQEQLANVIGVSRQTINTWEAKDKVKLTRNEVFLIAKTLKITDKDLLNVKTEHVALDLNVKRIPFYDIEASAGQYVAESGPTTLPAGTIDIGDILRDSEAAIRISGNSMMPGYPPGCVVGLIKRQSRSIQPGEVYVYETHDDRKLKRLYYENDDPNSDTFICYSDSTLKFESGPRAGLYHFPPYKVKIEEIINLFTVVGVIKRNANGYINYR